MSDHGRRTAITVNRSCKNEFGDSGASHHEFHQVLACFLTQIIAICRGGVGVEGVEGQF